MPLALAYPLRGQPSYMHQHGFDVLMVSADGKELPTLLQHEICPHQVVPMTRKITPFRDLWAIFLLIKLFRRERPDIVHTETPKAGLLGMIAAWLCGVNIRIHTVAGLPLMVEKGVKLAVLQWIEKITYGAATNVWPNSQSLMNFIKAHRFTSFDKLRLIGEGSSNGVDTQRFSRTALDPKITETVKAELHYDPSLRYMLFVGRMVLDKGIVELVHVFLRVYEKDRSLRLILAGNFEKSLDPLPQDIEDAIRNHPAIIHISWTDRVEYYMELSSYFVFPSYREGFPNVLLEAALMKLPIVCSRIAGNVDIVTHQQSGLLFESQDEQALFDQLSFALDHTDQMQEMANRLYQHVYHSFPREIFWEHMRQAYQELSA